MHTYEHKSESVDRVDIRIHCEQSRICTRDHNLDPRIEIRKSKFVGIIMELVFFVDCSAKW